MRRYLLIDGLNFFIRSFTVNPTMDMNGEHVGGTIGFLIGLNKLVREQRPTHIIVVWDGEGGSLKRRSIFKDYKAGRKPKVNRQYSFEDPNQQMESFRRQLEMLDKYLEFLPLTSIRIKGVEADDVIAYLWGFLLDKNDQKVIVSSDKDFYQLLDTKTVIYVPTKKKYFSSSDLRETLDILPENYILMKALMGDKSDNIDGIRGIGPKSVTKLFPFLSERFACTNDIFDHAEENKDANSKYNRILADREIVMNNVRLMQLSSPLMDPMAAKSIRYKLDESTNSYRPTDMKLQLFKDQLQLKPTDFFIMFKEQYFRARSKS